ncbi:GSCOCG00009582001-RA-CDS, partial [Cotesia congregata]
MKEKRVRHKETNTFKFKRFGDRIAEINVDVFHRIRHRNEDSDDEEQVETLFYRTLLKWNMINLTEGYKKFRMEVKGVVTLKQLIEFKQKVVDSLKYHLKVNDPAYLQAILEMVVAAARDLQREFHDFIPDFLVIIIDLLNTQDPDVLEFTFINLAYLFKFMWVYFVRNIDTTFEILLPLLADKRVYINNFAAESFAFVARKITDKDKNSFLTLLFSALKKKPSGVHGCGKLLFEVVSGVPGRFNSHAEKMFNIYFQVLEDESIDSELAFGVLSKIFECVNHSINPTHSKVFWDVIFQRLDQNSKSENEKVLVPLGKLLLIVLNHRGGRMLLDPVLLTSLIIKGISIFEKKSNLVLHEFIELSVSILLAENIQLSQETSPKLISELLAISKKEILIEIIEKLVNHSSFKTRVLPLALQQDVLTKEFTNNDLNLFTKIVSVRAPPKLNGINLDKLREINLNLHKYPTDTFTILIEKLKNWEEADDISEDSLRIITILPYVNILMKQELVTVLKQVLVSMFEKLIQDESVNKIEKRTFAFLLTLESIVHLLTEEEIDHFLEESTINFETLTAKYWDNTNILNAVDLFYTHISSTKFKDKYINVQTFDSLNTHLAKKLASPYRNVRLIVCHIYYLFKDVKEIFINKSNDSSSVLEIMFMAESIEVSVQSYRDRLSHLQALSFKSRSLIELHPRYYHGPLYFLLGNFFVNFSLLWEPVSQIIATYATGEFTDFWPTFLGELQKNFGTLSSCASGLFSCEILNNLSKSLITNDKPDYNNYQTLLWTCMNKFSEYSEARNRDLTVLFINFVENLEDEEEETKEDSEKTDDRKIEDLPIKKMNLVKMGGKTSNLKLLLAQLKLFSQMHNPRSLYREREMYDIYMDLLKSKSMELQKAVLDCVFTYKQRELLPYKEHLYGLTDEKNLRNELARFKVVDDHAPSETIKPEDRTIVMPILMRLIYAKMVTRGTGRAAGAAGGLARRKIIVRFLMGVKEEEMMLFAEMACKPFEKYQINFFTDDQFKDIRRLTTDLTKNVDLSNIIIHPERLRSAINLLSILIEEFGGKMSKNLLPRLLAILLCALAQINGILNRSKNVLSGFLSITKELKNTCMGILGRFFEHFETYEWSQAELDALFDVAVFPWLEKLPTEGVYSPTVLLKLFSAWCQNPRYHCLLIKHQEDNQKMICLPFIMKLLLGEKTHHTVVNTILEMIKNLLTLQDYEKMEVDDADTLPIVPLNPTNILEVNAETALPGKFINYGSAILLPYVPDVLEFLKRRLLKSKMNVKKIEAAILSRISELSLNSETSNTLTLLLIPIAVKRASRGESDQIIEELLITITNLLKNVDKPQEHLKSLLPLLFYISSVSLRKNLLEIFKTIVSKETMMRNLELLVSLNAMNPRWVEQPDCEKRLETFQQINSIISSQDDEVSKTLTLEFGVAVLYNCYHFLKHETDLALRSESRWCINTLGVKLINMYKSNNVDRLYLIEDTILSLIKEGIKSKNDHIKLQSISFFGTLSMNCSDAHPVFRDLHFLTNKIDPEVDFFENLQHSQVGRRGRALLKFCSFAKTLTKPPNIKTLTQFIFPLASSFLCDETYASKNSIVDAAIEAIGTICRLLPWHQYSVILKYYLDKINKVNEFQRQVIRIIIAILDAFHFDLAKLKIVDKIIDDQKTIDPPEKETETVEEENKPEEDTVEETNEERLDEELAKDEEKVSEETKEESAELVMEKLTVLSQSAAKKLVFDITHTLLPQLNRSILSRTQHELSHKVNRKRSGYEKEEEELMRVPIALALVKLLQKLPGPILNKSLSGIFMKLCTFLKSRLESVRRSTREILEKIMITLGPDFLHHLLKEMNSLLTKGFQIHVLAYTIHAVLNSLKPYLQSNHINNNLQSILQVCKVDLFGLTSEEKEVKAIIKNVSEAKSTKSISIFRILGEFISESCLIDLVQPFYEILCSTRSHKVLMKVVESLNNISVGLADNAFIEDIKILQFIGGIVSKSIPSLTSKSEDKKSEKNKSDKPQLNKPDCYIIPAAPKSRMGIKTASKTSADANEHVITEFAMKLLHILLKRDKITGAEFKDYMDPLVPIIADNLKSQHIKLGTLSLQSINKILLMNLDSIPQHIEGICETVFSILDKYGSAGLAKGDNFELVTAAFKTMSTFVRDMKTFNMTFNQIKVLILYIEQDLYNNERRATAFSLIKAIIERKIKASEIHQVIEKVSVLSVTSDSVDVQKQCREVFYKFLMEYPLGKKLEKHLSFYLAQLSYELTPGRMSALEMIHDIINGFPEDILIKQSALIFLMVGARLVNDEDPTCCKFAAKCVKVLITRVNHNQCLKLFEIVLQWLKDSNLLHRRLAVQLCGIFVAVKKEAFETHLEELLPLILKQFYASDSENQEEGKFVLKKTRRNNQVTIKDLDRVKDHLVFQTLQLTLKISSYCQVFLKSDKYVDQVQSLAEYAQSFLAHPHLWVRLAATQQIGFVLAAIDEDKLIKIIQESKKLNNTNNIKGYIYSNPIKTLRSLSLDLIAQLYPEMNVEELSDQVVKNLVFIARVIKSIPWSNDTPDKSEDTANNISIFWLLKRLKRSVNFEIRQYSKSPHVRTAVFKWIAGVVTTIDIDPFLKPILFQLMSPLVREMLTTEESSEALRQLSNE